MRRHDPRTGIGELPDATAELSSAGRGALLLSLFGGVFVLAGVWALLHLLPRAATPGDVEGRLAAGVLGLVFSVAGAGMIALAAFLRRRAGERFEQRRSHPEAPWMWDREWASREIAGSGRVALGVAWIFALFWNAISWPLVPKMVEALGRDRAVAAVGLLFPAVGIGLLAWALRETARQRRFGGTVFELSTLPGVIGGHLEGVVHLSRAFAPEGGFQVRLDCVRETRGAGSDDASQESILWQEKETIALHATRPGRLGTDVPVCFRIPWGESATGADGPRARVLWRLTVSARSAGVDFRSHFVVPVFVTADSDECLTDSGIEAPEIRDAVAAGRPPPGSKIGVTRRPGGGIELSFGAARNPGVAVGLTAFTGVWTAGTALLTRVGAPLFFALVFGCFATLLWVCVLDLWAGTTRVAVSPRGLTVTRRVLGIGRTREWPEGQVEKIEVGVGMQSGTKVFYRLRALAREGRPIACGDGIPEKREAEVLAELVETALRGGARQGQGGTASVS